MSAQATTTGAFQAEVSHQIVVARAAVSGLLAVFLAFTMGITAGAFTLLLGLVLAGSAWVQARLGRGTGAEVARGALILAETALVGWALFVVNPFDGHPAPPPGMIFFSPALLGFLCLLAMNAANVRPMTTWLTGAGILVVWTVARLHTLSDPITIVKEQVHDDDYDTLLAYLTAVTQPRFFNKDVWVLQMACVAGCTAILGVAAMRLNRLSRKAAAREAMRAGLAAHFSAPVVSALLDAEPGALTGKAELSVLDVDLTGFSSVAAGLSPDRIAALLRAYHSFVEQQVFEASGAVLKFTGDGVTAVFGLDGDPDAAALQAVACARRLVELWPGVVAPFDLVRAPGIAVGVESGPAEWGVVGEGRALSLVIVGAVVGAATRLQEETRRAGAPLLIGPAARARAGIADPPAPKPRKRPSRKVH